MMWKTVLSSALVIIFAAREGFAVKITSVAIPSTYIWHRTATNSSASTDLKLNCDYKLNDSETGFVLSWYFKDNKIYKWIPSLGNGQSYSDFKYNLDLNYTTVDGRHPALVIKTVDARYSGNYTCQVHTKQSTDRRSGRLQIIVPSTNFRITTETDKDDAENVLIKCSADEIVPETTLNIMVDKRPVTDKNDLNRTRCDNISGLFNTSTTVAVNRRTLSKTTTITCSLGVPGTEYAETCALEYSDSHAGQDEAYSSSGFVFISIKALIVISIVLNVLCIYYTISYTRNTF